MGIKTGRNSSTLRRQDLLLLLHVQEHVGHVFVLLADLMTQVAQRVLASRLIRLVLLFVLFGPRLIVSRFEFDGIAQWGKFFPDIYACIRACAIMQVRGRSCPRLKMLACLSVLIWVRLQHHVLALYV